jgi:hypothetical protein
MKDRKTATAAQSETRTPGIRSLLMKDGKHLFFLDGSGTADVVRRLDRPGQKSLFSLADNRLGIAAGVTVDTANGPRELVYVHAARAIDVPANV